ncbi:hypothetical protein V6N11_050611 [Hibiscus sabdariffa]|uniref:Uncharacterized protein n=1 Tax=Hibiscus sabdariffa TaxID=183260 RepID=A0ABR2TB47_9ROSI
MPVSSLFSFGVNLIHRGGRARPLQSIYRMELRFGLFLFVALIPNLSHPFLAKAVQETGVMVTFGLNALHGRHNIKRSLWGGDWDSSNAQEFLKYTISKGYNIDSWEFGNELSGHGSRVLDVMSHHMYNLGAGVDPKLISKILNPDHLNKASYTFGNLTHVIRRHGPWSSAWVGESGGAFNSGGSHVSNTFVNSFWYLDQLGMSALLWHRLMGKVVLSVESDASPFLRSYAHCSKGRAGVTLLVINLSNQTNFVMNVQNSINLKLAVNEQNISRGGFTHTLKKTFSWVGTKASNEALFREEYHLTPKDGYLQSQTMVLNGIPLEFTDSGNIPSLDPVHVNLKSPISISPLSIAFILFPNFEAPACG